MKYFLLSLLAVCLLPFQGICQTSSFNGGWSFALSDASGHPNAKMEAIHIPHTYNLDAYKTKDYYRGYAVYEKQFTIDKAEAGRLHYLHFEGVNSKAQVFLNDQLLGAHQGGYTAFNIALDKALKFGATNRLKVVVNNENKNLAPLSGDFTIFGGIYRDVWMVSKAKTHFDLDQLGGWGGIIRTPKVSASQASLSFEGKINSAQSQNLKMEVVLTAPDGSKVMAKTFKKYFHKGTKSWHVEMPTVNKPQLWSPDSPLLYHLTATLKDRHGRTLDTFSHQVGFRWFAINAQNQFELNGAPLKLIGASRHQDKAPYGIAVSDEQHFADMKMIKDMGGNFTRLAHYPQDPAVLDACDRLGIIVWQEIPLVDIMSKNEAFTSSATNMLKEMIEQYRNNPSIAIWGLMNEACIQVKYRIKKKEPRDLFCLWTAKFGKSLNKLAKEEDPSRLTAMAFNEDINYDRYGMSGIADITGWNLYPGWYGGQLKGFEHFIAEQHRLFPHRALFISEFGAGSDARIHANNPQKFDFSMEYQQKYLEHYLKVIQNTDYIMGGSVWNLADFSSASRQESMVHINNKGLVHLDHTPKDVYYFLQACLVKDRPIVHIATDDWANRTQVTEGDRAKIEVKVYTNQNHLSLFVNGIDHGERTVRNHIARWKMQNKSGVYQLIAAKNRTMDVATLSLNNIPAKLKKGAPVNIHINAGSSVIYTDHAKTTWFADRAYSEGGWGFIGGEHFKQGDRNGTVATIKDTDEQPLFQTARIGDFSYKFDVAPGTYQLALNFADLSNWGPQSAYLLNNQQGQQTKVGAIDVEINGKVVLKNFTPAQVVGGHRALVKKLLIQNDQQQLNIKITGSNGQAFLNGLSLISK
ncbi:glycoside hydrolase family 2 TIM barrel-domain containing protein [Persicobacter psychrovividus]|uniref:Beta-galactosidase n=1 Tax=Persicobacter psychrovividus TaxID=387638 RepID=A0ABN6LD39_9BACT|nr:beta-galactosidase [Persicobacter psychrovividus]